VDLEEPIVSEHNAPVVAEFRANGGRVGGHFEGRPLLLLTHRGRRTGRLRLNPLAYLERDGRIFVFASKGGSPHHPHWFWNLTADPHVVVERGTDRYEATAVEITGPERDRTYAAQVAAWPQFGAYERKTRRTIPVVELIPKRTPGSAG
jgi:deazaflavin-dependent oxidoreductase (nitroreductase family)